MIRFGVLCVGVSFDKVMFFVVSNELFGLYLERFWLKIGGSLVMRVKVVVYVFIWCILGMYVYIVGDVGSWVDISCDE